MQTQPLSFAANQQTDIHGVEKRVETDAQMFVEVAEILKKHGLQNKYGVTLLHKHFDLREDEVLVEFTDIEKRILTSKPVRIGEIPEKNLIETNWCLNGDAVAGVCVVFCHFSYGQHKGVHEAR